jgi:hypothetical protein
MQMPTKDRLARKTKRSATPIVDSKVLTISIILAIMANAVL